LTSTLDCWISFFSGSASIEVAPWLPPLVAFCISLFTSMGGVSGAFLLLPFQMSFLGYDSPSVSATNHVFNVVAIPSGVYRYHREGRMVWPLTSVLVAGTLPGVFIGAFLRVVYLPDPKNFKLFAAFVLLYIGLSMIGDLLRKASPGAASEVRFQRLVHEHREKSPGSNPKARAALAGVQMTHLTRRSIGYAFYGEQFCVSTWKMLALSFAVGIVGGIYGIGSGAIIAPILVSVFGLPVYTVAGAALCGTFVTSVAAVVFYQAIAPLSPDLSVAPDWGLGVLFGLGGLVGMYAGARLQKYFPANAIKWLLTGIILFTAGEYVRAFIG